MNGAGLGNIEISRRAERDLRKLAITDARRVRAISLLGVFAAFAYLAWRFGPTIARTTGWCSWWVAWACGSQGAYAYCIAFAVFGALAWGGGSVWYAHRRGHWPSALSARLLPRVLGRRGLLTRT